MISLLTYLIRLHEYCDIDPIEWQPSAGIDAGDVFVFVKQCDEITEQFFKWEIWNADDFVGLVFLPRIKNAYINIINASKHLHPRRNPSSSHYNEVASKISSFENAVEFTMNQIKTSMIEKYERGIEYDEGIII